MNCATIIDTEKKGCVISHVLVIGWMLVIFCFTAQTGEESGNLSQGFIHSLVTMINQWLGGIWEKDKIPLIVQMLGFPVRKLAHMTEFGILAALLYRVSKYYTRINTCRKRICCSWIVAVIYAATDEFHQLYVPGRSGNLFDVCVDAAGALLALGFIVFIASRKKKVLAV